MPPLVSGTRVVSAKLTPASKAVADAQAGLMSSQASAQRLKSVRTPLPYPKGKKAKPINASGLKGSTTSHGRL